MLGVTAVANTYMRKAQRVTLSYTYQVKHYTVVLDYKVNESNLTECKQSSNAIIEADYRCIKFEGFDRKTEKELFGQKYRITNTKIITKKTLSSKYDIVKVFITEYFSNGMELVCSRRSFCYNAIIHDFVWVVKQNFELFCKQHCPKLEYG